MNKILSLTLSVIFVAATAHNAHGADVYVGLFGDGWIYKVDSETGAKSVVATDLPWILDLAIDANGILYIGGAQYGVRRVDTHTGERLPDVGTNICGPEGVTVDAHGNVYASTAPWLCPHSGVWRIEGGTAAIAEQVIPPFAFTSNGVAFLTEGPYNGCLMATGGGSGAGNVISCPPDFETAIPFGVGDGAHGLAIDGLGFIYKSGSGAQTGPGGSVDYIGGVARFSPENGEFLDRPITDLDQVGYMEFDEFDNLYIATILEDDYDGNLTRVSPNGIKTILTTFPTFSFPNGVAIGLPRMTGVRVVDTISTADIVIDENSFSHPPASITTLADRTIIEWHFEEFSIGQLERLTFDATVKNPTSGETRLVNHKLELYYADLDGTEWRRELGAGFVQVLDSTFAVSVSTNQTQYFANSDVLVDSAFQNPGIFARTVDAVVRIEDQSGNLFQEILNLPGLVLEPSQTISETPVFHTGGLPGGTYRAHALVYENGVLIAEAATDFTVTKNQGIAANVIADRTSYGVNEPVTITSTVSSTGLNASLSDVQAVVTIVNPVGATVYSQIYELGALSVNSIQTINSVWGTGANRSGTYTIRLTATASGGLEAVSTAGFSIQSSLTEDAAMAGTISLDPEAIIETESTQATYSIQNVGNTGTLPGFTAEILVIDISTETVVRTISRSIPILLAGGEVYTESFSFDSNGLVPGHYILLLKAKVTVAGRGGGTTIVSEQDLATTTLTVLPIPNTAPLADAGPDQAGYVGQPIMLDGTGSSDPDVDSLAYVWSFSSVPEESTVSDAYLMNPITPTPSFVPDIEGIYVLRLVVNDGLLDSPIDTVSVFVNPPPSVDLHPEKINLKSSGGSNSVTVMLSSPVLSSFEFVTADDGVTVTGEFSITHYFIDLGGSLVSFTTPITESTEDDLVQQADLDGDGTIDAYELTLKVDRQAILNGFTDAGGNIRILADTEFTSTVIANGIPLGSDVNTALAP